MNIKSAKTFREWYKNLTPARVQASEYWDADFMGAQHNDLSGFFSMYHGDKTQINDFLRKEVEMAEDGQAIYEFVQNAADSDSTKFYMFYNQEHLIVLNNGTVFSKEGVKSILNIGQSYGKKDVNKIGRYGIGFKLVHRLVGKSSGLTELLNQDANGYRGPVLFSWSDKSQFTNFLKADTYNFVDSGNNDAPWLLKILLTNFPAEPLEQVKDINYNPIEPFSRQELNGFQNFLNACMDKIDSDTLNSGTIFYLKLGEGKFDYLQNQQENYINGLATSMHFLKSLDTIVINEQIIKKEQEVSNILEFTIKNGSQEFDSIGLTEARDKESDANFKICFSNNLDGCVKLKQHPNIYKYFPAVKEVNNLSLVIHSNLFELSSNRQNLTETPINKRLLQLLSQQIINKMELLKTEDPKQFNRLFCNILMSDRSIGAASGNSWQDQFFFDVLLQYIKNNIPTSTSVYGTQSGNVKINNLKIKLDLADFGLSHLHWFKWESAEYNRLIEQAKEESKLALKAWDIRDIVENANIEKINYWIESCNETTYKAFLDELEHSNLRSGTKDKIRKIKLFKFSSDVFYTFEDIINKNGAKGVYNYTNVLISTNKTKGIESVLHELGLITSILSKEDYPNLFSTAYIPSDKDSYKLIAQACKANTLEADQKKELFLNLVNQDTKFDNVEYADLKELVLFNNASGELTPLNKLVGKVNLSTWINPYKIDSNEHFQQLDKYLITEAKDVFNTIYLPNKEDIFENATETSEIQSIIDLYKENDYSLFKNHIIVEHSYGYQIVVKGQDTFQVYANNKILNDFINEYCQDSLFVLPVVFNEQSQDNYIVKQEKLYLTLLDNIDIEEHQEILVDLIKYPEAKIKFLKALKTVAFDTDQTYTTESYQYKIVNLACELIQYAKEVDFKEKVTIDYNDETLTLSDIPPVADLITINHVEISLSKILPDNYQNSDILNRLINNFKDLKIDTDKLNILFGVNSDSNIEDIYKIFSERIELLENQEQLAFLLLYHTYEQSVDLSQYVVLNIDQQKVSLEGVKYINDFDFIERDNILDYRYKAISKIFNKPYALEDSSKELLLIKEPYFENKEFICPGIEYHLDQEQQQEILEFIFKKWTDDKYKKTVQELKLDKIQGTDVEDILGFEPLYSVYPSQYALGDETLPDYVINWIEKDDSESKVNFLKDLGLWTLDTTIVELRKFLQGEITEFKNSQLMQQARFNDDTTMLYNCLEWLKQTNIVLENALQYDIFKSIVELINDDNSVSDIEIIEEPDFDTLYEKSTLWSDPAYINWAKEHNIQIYLYTGKMPQSILVDDFGDYAFYTIYCLDIIDNQTNLDVFINSEVNDKLQILKELDSDTYDFNALWLSSNQEKDKVIKSKDQTIAELQSRLAQLEGGYADNSVKINTDSFGGIAKMDQIQTNIEAKEIVKQKLESEGFVFTQGLGEYSTIDGVIKDNVEYPLVVKSYKNHDAPFKISANEWIHLMKDNAMFWVVFGQDKLGCIKLDELLKKQDQLTISFNTENLSNENRINEFAKILKYFKNVHFDFNSFKVDRYSLAQELTHYNFNQRKQETDLSEDHQDLL